ncbi:MAG: hypothetical protein M3229_01945 [Actinomycetota bacterium]|nr:hypothetical protein [Actinomycetota bacterium]
MNAPREAQELVRLWQELQEAQVAGDGARLTGLRLHAEAQARRPDASPEWELLAREADKHSSRVSEAREAQPTAGVAAEARAESYRVEEEWELDEVSAPDAAREPAEETTSRGRRLGPLIWVVILVGYLILQMLNGLNGGD